MPTYFHLQALANLQTICKQFASNPPKTPHFFPFFPVFGQQKSTEFRTEIGAKLRVN
jgi:hypothetical protein